jgi:hypothetical protein
MGEGQQVQALGLDLPAILRYRVCVSGGFRFRRQIGKFSGEMPSVGCG